MQYERFTEEAVASLKASRPVSEDEYRELTEQLAANVEVERERIGQITTPWRRDRFEEALGIAALKIMNVMDKEWRAGGTARPWVTGPQYLRAAGNTAASDIARAQTVPAPEGAGGEADFDPAPARAPRTARFVPLSDSTISTSDHRAVDNYLSAMAPSVLSLVATRALDVVASRAAQPRMSEIAATVTRFFLELDLGLDALSQQDVELAAKLPDQWKGALAASLDVKPGRVSEALEIVATRIREAVYLFVVLAPIGDAVIEREVMSTLYDVAYVDGHGLVTATRKLLQKAGPLLERRDHDWRIDLGLYLQTARRDLATTLEQRSDAQVLTGLHRAEALYASHVPHQHYSPPRFRCVIRCPEHHRPV